MESWNQATFDGAVGRNVTFVQDNQSVSKRGVLRGLHYQLPPHAQGKLVRCTRGAIWDVAVDIRRSSPTFGEWFGIELTELSAQQVWISEGFAHGFLALTDHATLQYKTTDFYAPELDRTMAWDDPNLDIGWPIQSAVIVSDKDRTGISFETAEVFS